MAEFGTRPVICVNLRNLRFNSDSWDRRVGFTGQVIQDFRRPDPQVFLGELRFELRALCDEIGPRGSEQKTHFDTEVTEFE